MAYPISKFWFYPLFTILIRVKGMENIPENTNFIIVSNHEHLIDPLCILYPILKKLNKKVHFLTTGRWWFLGDMICRQWAGTIPLFNRKQAYEESKNQIKSGEIIGVFPEGGIKRTKQPKTGAVRLALETNTPILPIALKFHYTSLSSKVTIGKPVYPNKIKNIEKQTLDLMNHIYSLRGN